MNLNTNKICTILLIIAVAFISCTSTPDNTKTTKEEKVFEEISYYITLGDMDAAIEAYEKSYEKNPDDPKTIILYARLLMLGGMAEDARALLKDLLIKDPANTDAIYTLSLLEGAEGNKEEQKLLLTSVINEQQDFSDAYASLGEIYLKENDLVNAEENFNKALESNPENFVAIIGMGNILIQKEEYSNAEEYFNDAVTLEPDYSFALVDRAFVRRKQGNYTGAIEDMTKAIELDPEFYWNYLDRGKIYLAKSDTKNAITDFNNAINIDPEYFLAHLYLANIYYDDEIWYKAKEHYEIAMENKKDYYYGYIPLGILRYMQEEWDGATDLFKMAYEHEKEHSYALMAVLGYKMAGKEETAMKYLDSVLGNFPTEGWHYSVALFFKRPENDLALINYMKKEENKLIKKRILFYLASQYLVMGRERAAQLYFMDIIEMEQMGVLEKILAQNELKDLEE